VRSVNYATSPLLASKTPPWRSKFLVALVAVGFLLLLGRAAYVQILTTGFYQKEGEKRYGRVLELPASRGRIVDRNGQILAASVPAPSIWAIPRDVEASPSQRRKLAKLLDMSVSELDKKLDRDSSFAWLKRQVDDDTWAQVKALDIAGIYQVGEYKRRYPEGEAAAPVVGFTDIEDKGQEGVELAFQNLLQGHDGSRSVVKDRMGRVIEDLGAQEAPLDGSDVQLSLDSQIQFFAYQRIRDAVIANKAKAGSVVVLDALTGEILALANYPSFDPDDRGAWQGGELRNRAVTDIFEPGSTMKPFIVAHALDTHRVTPDTLINVTPGSLVVGGKVITDAERGETILTVRQVIQKSSNIGAARIALQFTPHEMWDVMTAAGFGQKPQIQFPGVATGRLRSWKGWRPIEQATMAYGYGVSASLLQIARAYTAFSRDGEVIPVTLHKLDQPPAAGVRVMTPQSAELLRQMLQMVAAPGGTSPKAQTIGYSVGGKSGTAYKQEGKGYAAHKYRAWFVGLSPISKPRLIVGVMVDEPNGPSHFGGDVAAPVFSQVVQQSLHMMNVPPDIPITSQIVTTGGVEESF
jgi:cell division protein FtsI (penicillin-binding protein 3)